MCTAPRRGSASGRRKNRRTALPTHPEEEMNPLPLPEDNTLPLEASLPGVEEQQQEPRSRKRPLLYECPKFEGCEEEFKLLRKVKKLNREVDVALTRRRLFVGQECRNPSEVDRVLQLHIYHTFKKNVNSSGLYDFSLKICGHVLDPMTNKPVTNEFEKMEYSLTKLAWQLSVVFDPPSAIVGDKARFDWVRGQDQEFQDGISITQQCTSECTAQIYVYLDSQKKANKLSDQLLRISGAPISAQYSSMESILQSIFIYAKRNNLISTQQPELIRCDTALQEIFGREHVHIATVEESIKPHVKESPPVMRSHRISLSGSVRDNCDCYELLVKVPLSTGKAASNDVMQLSSTQPEVENTNVRMEMIEEKIRELYAEIEEKKQEYDFFKAYATTPVDTIDVTISAAENLLKNIAEYGYEWKQKALSSYYKGPWVNRAIRRFISQSQEQPLN